jgi:fumarate reductase subunit D
MRHPLLPLEPLVWLLFGAGIMVGTMLMTGWLLVVGLGVPLGIVSADALAFGRASSLGATLIGRVLLLAIVALPLWKGAHHTRHLVIDTFGAERDAVVGPILYLIATAGSLLAIVAVVRL